MNCDFSNYGSIEALEDVQLNVWRLGCGTGERGRTFVAIMKRGISLCLIVISAAGYRAVARETFSYDDQTLGSFPSLSSQVKFLTTPL